MELESKRLLFREVSTDDIPEIHRLHSIPEVDEFNTLGIPKTIEETEAILQPAFEEQKNAIRKSYQWVIQLKAEKRTVGMCGIFLSNDKFRLGEIYYKFDPAHWGNGYATETACKLIDVGFEFFNLHKVEAGVATENHRSIHVLEKANMTREGLRRKILPIRGKWVDNYHYAIVEDDPR